MSVRFDGHRLARAKRADRYCTTASVTTTVAVNKYVSFTISNHFALNNPSHLFHTHPLLPTQAAEADVQPEGQASLMEQIVNNLQLVIEGVDIRYVVTHGCDKPCRILCR